MKKTKIAKTLMVMGFIGFIGFSSDSAFAASENQNSTGEVTFTAGDITLDEVPNFNFGQQQISTVNKDYDAQQQSKIQVTDLRGSSAGWNLTVTADKLTAGSKELDGAQVSLANGAIVNSSNETINAADVTLTPTQAVKVMDAATNSGNGVTTGTWTPTDVKLFVPGSSTKSATKYSANLTWTLTDAPLIP